jgi:hypothetical protein
MAEGVIATSYSSGQKFYIDPMKLLPLERFLPKPKASSRLHLVLICIHHVVSRSTAKGSGLLGGLLGIWRDRRMAALRKVVQGGPRLAAAFQPRGLSGVP